MDFGRLVTAMVTPFTESNQIDWARVAELIEWLIYEQMTDSIVINGTTGESPTLSEDEKLELYRFAVKQVAGRVKIIAGTGDNETAYSVHMSKLAEEAGVDGLLLVAPYYNRPSQEGLYQHFYTIAQATKLPIMIYNIPGRTGVNISTETTLRLAQLPNIVATKEASGDLQQMTDIIAAAPAGFRLYSGDDSLTLPAMAVGAYGIVSVASHIIGQPIKNMMNAFLAGKVDEAAKLHRQWTPIFKGLFACPHRVPNPVPVKHALKLSGLPVGGVRLPLVDVTPEEAQFLQNLLKSNKLI